MAVMERRWNPRVDVTKPCVLDRRDGTAAVGRTTDLGPGGMHVVTPQSLAIDDLVEFEVFVGRPVDDGDIGITGRARVVGVDADGGYAMRFEELSGAALQQLWDLAAPRRGR